MATENSSLQQKSPHALLVGAGFSVDMKMPLVTELTAMIRLALSEDGLETIYESSGRWLYPLPMWKRAAIQMLAPEKMHYEQYVGTLEDRILSLDELEDAISQRLWFMELVSWMLILKHVFLRHSIALGAVKYSGLRQLLPKSSPLWVFSLNHDVCFEVVAATFNIPIASCATRLTTTSRQHPRDPVEIVEKAIAEDEIMWRRNFFEPGEHGVNILKLHGSLNEFVDIKDDGTTQLVHMSPSNLIPLKWLDLLGAINTGPWGEGGSTVALNHLPSRASSPRHLMRTVLTGSHKMANDELIHRRFGGPALASPKAEARSHVPRVFQRPEMTRPLREQYINKMFGILDDVLPTIRHLIAIGCSLTDEHINERILKWLNIDPQRKLTVVRPNNNSVPPWLDVVARQVELVSGGTTEYLESLEAS